jgi:hypothetical protein
LSERNLEREGYDDEFGRLLALAHTSMATMHHRD